MPQKTWSAKRERQYAHIKDSLIDRGKKDRNSNRMSPSMAPKTGLTKHACPQSPV